MKVVYTAQSYKPELVTGRYARVEGSKRKGYVFKVFECETGHGRYVRGPGTGATLREYETDGAELPEDLKARCMQSRQTERWD